MASSVTIPLKLTAEEIGSHCNRLVLISGAVIALIGLGGIAGYAFGVPWLLSYMHDATTPKMGLPTAMGLFFLGIAIATIMDGRPYNQRPQWLWPVRHISLLILISIGLYVTYLYLVRSGFNLFSILTENFISIIPSFLENFILLLSSGILLLFLKLKRSETLIVYLINVPAMFILCLVLFALLGYWQDIPLLFGFKLSLPAAIAYLLAGMAVLTGTIQFQGLLLPFFLESPLARLMAFSAIVMGIGVLIAGAFNISQFDNHIIHTGIKSFELTLHRIYINSELVSVVLSILIMTLSLRTVHYFNKSAFYAKEQALAKENEHLRRMFVSTLTHDLRTPLIAQKRVLEVLEKEPKIQDDKNLSLLIEGFLKNNAHLLTMVNILLETYQYEEGHIQLAMEAIDFRQLITECLSEVESLASTKEIELDNQVPSDLPIIQGDFNQLKRIFLNLLGNAIENIPKKSFIRITARNQGSFIEIKVQDNGPGIEPSLLPHLFERYFTGHPTRQKIGSGLGLFICKMIVELHGGIIKAESEVGKGSCFIIRLARGSFQEGKIQ